LCPNASQMEIAEFGGAEEQTLSFASHHMANRNVFYLSIIAPSFPIASTRGFVNCQLGSERCSRKQCRTTTWATTAVFSASVFRGDPPGGRSETAAQRMSKWGDDCAFIGSTPFQSSMARLLPTRSNGLPANATSGRLPWLIAEPNAKCRASYCFVYTHARPKINGSTRQRILLAI
jgi:hypothetical protein